MYTGVTSDLSKRLQEHKTGIGSKFTAKYNLKTLVYYESCENIMTAIIREKQIKDMNRKDKINMIKIHNPGLKDLSNTLL